MVGGGPRGVRARDMRVSMPHPTAGEVQVTGSPLKLSATPVEYRLPPPLLGEHTEQILMSLLGYSPQDVERLRSEDAV